MFSRSYIRTAVVSRACIPGLSRPVAGAWAQSVGGCHLLLAQTSGYAAQTSGPYWFGAELGPPLHSSSRLLQLRTAASRTSRTGCARWPEVSQVDGHMTVHQAVQQHPVLAEESLPPEQQRVGTSGPPRWLILIG